MTTEKNGIMNLNELFKHLAQYGIAGIIAGFLIWAMVTRMDNSISTIRENLILHASDSAYTVKRLEQVERILQRICYNTSETQANRNACFQ